MSIDQTDIELLSGVNLYDILGFNSKEEFTPELAKKLYRKLALKYHPDKNQDIPVEKFESIQIAYLVLATPEFKEQYDNAYEAKSQNKDFKDLIENYNKEKISHCTHKEQITQTEFKERIHDLNIKNNDTFTDDILDTYTHLQKEKELVEEREMHISEIYKQHKKDLESLSEISNQSELNKKFNELFDSRTQIIDNSTTLTVFNGCNSLCEYTNLSNMSYDSMYSTNSLYDESFKLNNAPVYNSDNKTWKERMEEYNNSTNELADIAKKSNSKNLQPAVFM
jgi:curved DNA-binding protein CbpA